MELRAPCKHTFYSYTHPQPVGWVKSEKNLNMVMVHIKLKKKKCRLT